MNLKTPQLEAALATELAVRADRFEALSQLRRQKVTLEPQIAVAELLLTDSDREVARLRQQLHRRAK